jgi:hypothetical protein
MTSPTTTVFPKFLGLPCQSSSYPCVCSEFVQDTVSFAPFCLSVLCNYYCSTTAALRSFCLTSQLCLCSQISPATMSLLESLAPYVDLDKQSFYSMSQHRGEPAISPNLPDTNCSSLCCVDRLQPYLLEVSFGKFSCVVYLSLTNSRSASLPVEVRIPR